jgi:hypothetical protein
MSFALWEHQEASSNCTHEWHQFVERARSLEEFHAGLARIRGHHWPRSRARKIRLTCPRVVVAGDFFTRFSSFFMDGVRDRYAERGIILKPVDLSDLFLYFTYDEMAATAKQWGVEPGGFAMAKACTRIFEPEGRSICSNGPGIRCCRAWRNITAGCFRKPAYW